MTLMVKAPRQLRERYMLTVEQSKRIAGVVMMPAGTSREEAVHLMGDTVRRDEALVKGTAVLDFGVAVYRLWKLEGSTDSEDVEV